MKKEDLHTRRCIWNITIDGKWRDGDLSVNDLNLLSLYQIKYMLFKGLDIGIVTNVRSFAAMGAGKDED